MARTKRAVGKTGIYHILLRGVNNLFLNKDYYDEFINILKKHIDEGHIKVIAYVLLKNRVHLVIDAKGEEIGKRLKPITTSYARYFNRMCATNGKLFYDRFKSEPIDTKQDLKGVVTFVNAIAGFEDKNYIYSSVKAPLIAIKDSGLTKAEIESETITQMYIEDYDCLSKTELVKYVTAFCGVSPREFKTLSQMEQEKALDKLTEKFWISKFKIYELMGAKKNQPKSIKKTSKKSVEKPKKHL